jgi:tRNA1(Val) A37 N6-methylase TrmN6
VAFPSRPKLPSELSSDAVLGGGLRFQQPLTGYRVNVDSILLAAFVAEGRRSRVAVDLGAGVGLISLLLARHGAAEQLILVERDPALARLALENLRRESVVGEVMCLDLGNSTQTQALHGRADLVVSNPPFFEEAGHRAPKDLETKRARMGRLEPFLEVAALALSGAKARAAFVYPARALTELFALAGKYGLVPKRLRFVHPFEHRPARIALLQLRKARPGGLVVEAPLIEWEAPGVPSAELLRLSAGKASDRE